MPRKPKTALENATALLASRGHSTQELRKKLTAKNIYSAEEIEAALSDLERMGFLNDANFAEAAVREWKDRGCGRLRIAQKLRMKGIAPELIEEKLRADDAEDGRDPYTLALDVLNKKARSIRAVADPAKRKAKAVRLLAARGYPAGCAFRAANTFLHAEDTEE